MHIIDMCLMNMVSTVLKTAFYIKTLIYYLV